MSNNNRMDEDEWDVEKILDKSTSKYGRVLYLVKWKNFNEAASSWEPVENLSCSDLIAEFEEELEKQNQSEAVAATVMDGSSAMGVISSGAISSTGRPIHSNTPSPAYSRSDRENSADSANYAHQLENTDAASRNEIVPAVCRENSPFLISPCGRREEEDLRRAEAKFEEGYIAEKIVGAINIRDSIRFLIKWRDRLECDLVHSKTARRKCPQLILDFYEKNIQWT